VAPHFDFDEAARVVVAVYQGRAGERREGRLAGWIRRIWVAAEIMIKGVILLKNHYQILNRRGGRLEIPRIRRLRSSRENQ
jgi:hypothetical protein